MALPEASVSRSKGMVKSGTARVGASVMAFLSVWNECSASGDHIKESFLRRLVRGDAMEA